MTSKEALNYLCLLATTPELAMAVQNCFDVIAKDLEVLENLRNHIEKIDITKSYCEMDIEIIKEWLKEDKEWGQYE